jgi:cation diffusion facilitator family transporter
VTAETPGAASPSRTETSTTAQLRASYARGVRATAFGLVISALLASVKIAAGVLGNSYALIADGVESVLDLFSSIMVWGGLLLSAAPRTDDYPYGRGKAESLAAILIATMLLVAAGGIAAGAISEIRTPQRPPAPFTLAVLVGVIAAKELVFRILLRRGGQIGSTAMRADAWHHRSDALTSLAAFVGISVALIAGEEWASADDWAALVACGVIAWNGSSLLRNGLRDVLDAAAPEDIQSRIRDLAAAVPAVAGIDELRVRKSGLVYFVDIHVEVDDHLTVRAGHEIGHTVKDALLVSELPVLDVLVHIEPAGNGRR